LATLADLDDVFRRVDVGDFDVCVVGLHSYSWFEALSAHIHGLGTMKSRCVLAVPHINSESILLALRCGANAILDLGLSSEELAQVLHGVSSGRIDLARNRLVGDVQKLSPNDSVLRHCRNELDIEILSHLIDGCSNDEIAERCCVAIQTVRNRLVRLMAAGQIDNRTQLVTRLVRS
jgi:DNA-binding NarL/FixJ family response regulator